MLTCFRRNKLTWGKPIQRELKADSNPSSGLNFGPGPGRHRKTTPNQTHNRNLNPDLNWVILLTTDWMKHVAISTIRQSLVKIAKQFEVKLLISYNEW